jgi:hypothetical protein
MKSPIAQADSTSEDSDTVDEGVAYGNYNFYFSKSW